MNDAIPILFWVQIVSFCGLVVCSCVPRIPTMVCFGWLLLDMAIFAAYNAMIPAKMDIRLDLVVLLPSMMLVVVLVFVGAILRRGRRARAGHKG